MPHVIDDSLLLRSLLFCRFSLAAYSDNDPRLIEGLNNGRLTFDRRMPANTQVNETDTQVLVCRWNNDVVAAFRGTELKLRDWFSDLDGKLVPNQGGGGRVHSGFQTALHSVYPQILKCIRETAVADKSRLFVCGHSLGGALSLLFASRYLQESPGAGQSLPQLCEVFTYGAPRIGDETCADSFRRTSIASHSYCWANPADPVTRVAPVFLEYRHALQRQLFVDRLGWVRHMDIDSTVLPESDDRGLLQSFVETVHGASIAASLQFSSHRLETSYLQQLQQAAAHPAGS